MYYSAETVFYKLQEHYNIFNPIIKEENDKSITYKYQFMDSAQIVVSKCKKKEKYEAKIWRFIHDDWVEDKIYPVSFSELCNLLEEYLY